MKTVNIRIAKARADVTNMVSGRGEQAGRDVDHLAPTLYVNEP